MFITLLKSNVNISSSKIIIDAMDFVTWFKDMFSLGKSGRIIFLLKNSTTKSKGRKHNCSVWVQYYTLLLCKSCDFLLKTKDGIFS